METGKKDSLRKKPFKMGREKLEQWIAALRSGKYVQGSDMLYKKTYDTYCCLGVLGNVCGIDKERMVGVGMFTQKNRFEKDDIPKELVIDQNSTRFHLAQVLVSLNDGIKHDSLKAIRNEYPTMVLEEVQEGEPLSFENIAKFLENNVEPV